MHVLLDGQQRPADPGVHQRALGRDEQYRETAAKSDEEIRRLEEEIFSLNHDYDEKLSVLKQKIEDAKKANAQIIRNTN